MIESILVVIAGLIGYQILQNRRSGVSSPVQPPTNPAHIVDDGDSSIPYFILFQKYAAKWKIPLRLFVAIVETESNFDAKAFNPEVIADKKRGRDVNSVGLGQILFPDTARVLADRVGITINSETDLYDADKNLNLTANFINELLRRYPKTDAYGFHSEAVASYNAGKPIYQDGKLINQTHVDKARRNWFKYGGLDNGK